MPDEAAVLQRMWSELADTDPRLAELLDGGRARGARLKRVVDAVLMQFARTYVCGYVVFGT